MTSVADRLGFGPERQATRLLDGSYCITVTPPAWTGFRPNEVRLTFEQFQRYRRWRDGECLVQDALPELSDDEREILMSGIGPEDWRKFNE